MATRVSCGAAEITSSLDMKTPRGHRRVREPGGNAGRVFRSCESGASGCGLVPRVYFALQVPRPGCSRAFVRAMRTSAIWLSRPGCAPTKPGLQRSGNRIDLANHLVRV